MTALKCTKSTKLTEFQFRFLFLATNVSLVKMGYKDDIGCSFYHEEAENFTHLYWFCSKIELFWKHPIAFLKDRKLLSNDSLLKIVFVTVAFGIGVDIPSIRRVFHIGVPKTMEEYFQETCRAGRNGNEPTATLFYNGRDVGKAGGGKFSG